jgi:uncharacterized membrane protein YbhN (UPF0104 family)
MSPGCRRGLAAGAVLLVLVLLVRQVGAGPFLAGLRRLDGATVAGAVALTAVATLAAAWRWSVLGGALGAAIPLRSAVQDSYRSQLLNSVLPGGVAGDVHRAVAGDPAGRAARIRAVVWDRGSGQVVQGALLAAALLLAAPAAWPVVAAAAVLLGAGAVVLRSRGGRRARWRTALRDDLRAVVRRPATVAAVVAASLVVVLCHAAVLVLAAIATGTRADPALLLPLAVAVQAAAVVPTGFGGWGVREGAAAAVFAASGLGAAQGVAAATAAGVLALVAVLPGVVPLLHGRAHRRAVAR